MAFEGRNVEAPFPSLRLTAPALSARLDGPVTLSTLARLVASGTAVSKADLVQAAGLDEGATFVVELDPADPDIVRLRRVRSSYAGALNGLYEPTAEYLAGERAGWTDR